MIKLKLKYTLYYCLYKGDFGYPKNYFYIYFLFFYFFYKTAYDVSNSLLVTNTKNATDYFSYTELIRVNRKS